MYTYMYIYIYIYVYTDILFRFFSIMVYLRILNIVPVLYSWALFLSILYVIVCNNFVTLKL